jgi:DNA-directed RNA polymerase specialized sigma24 family protein
MKDRSYLEITEELDVPVGTVKTWLFRARKQLKERFENSEAVAM